MSMMRGLAGISVPGDAALDRLEQPVVGAARRPHLRDVGRADAARVHAVAVGTAPAKQAHPAADGVWVSFERVFCRRILGGEKTAAKRPTAPRLRAASAHIS